MNAFAYKTASEARAAHRFLGSEAQGLLFDGLVEISGHGVDLFIPRLDVDATRALIFHAAERTAAPDLSIDPVALAAVQTAESRSLDQQQRLALSAMITKPISLTTGGPGTGKSTVASIACRYFQEETASVKIACAAFSARAAAAIAHKCDSEAFTLHSLVGVKPGAEAAFGRRDLRDYDVLIVDEVFSAEPALVLNILRATKPTTRVILIGDPDQLPPIGQARALHDLAEIGALHHVHLEQAHRLGGSSSHLGSQTRRIAAGHEPVAGPGLQILTLKRSMGAAEAARIAARLYREHAAQDLSSIVLTPTQYGAAGHRAINSMILGRATLSVGDPVITIQSCVQGRYRNGEQGFVTAGPDDSLHVALSDRAISLDAIDPRHIQAAHSMSAHRAQGLEFDRVIVVLTRDMSRTASRQLLVSATTRARHCTLITERGVLGEIVARDDLATRPNLVRSLKVET